MLRITQRLLSALLKKTGKGLHKVACQKSKYNGATYDECLYKKHNFFITEIYIYTYIHICTYLILILHLVLFIVKV